MKLLSTKYHGVPLLTACALSALLAMNPLIAREPDDRTECTGKPTRSQTEGPYFTAGSPERSSLLSPGSSGKKIIVSGYVFDIACNPIAGVRIDFWQADEKGSYDNSGFRFRGHQFTNASGRYRLETLIPGDYYGRTSHIHVKLTRPGGRTLTTQIYFPGNPHNESDGIFDSSLVVRFEPGNDGAAFFNFVLP